MHNCRRIEKHLLDLLFDDVEIEQRARLLREIEGCAHCLGQYQSLSETLLVVERTAEAALPPEGYWSQYSARLLNRMTAQAETVRPEKSVRAPLWRRLLMARLPVPAAAAAALLIGLVISSAMALRPAPTPQLSIAPAPSTVEVVKIVEVPVIQERVVTRTVYVEKRRGPERPLRPAQEAPARSSEINDSTIARSKVDEETGFFTRANLKGFQPADEMRIRVLKRNNTNEK